MKLCAACKLKLDTFFARFKNPEAKISGLCYGHCKKQFNSSGNTDYSIKTCYQYFVEKISRTINQPERSKREDSLIHCNNCECGCDCGDNYLPHNYLCVVSKRRKADAVL